MTTELPEREFEVLWDGGEFSLSRVRPQADRGPMLVVIASALGAFVAIEHVEQRVTRARGTSA